MAKTTILKCELQHLSILDAEGRIDPKLEPKLDNDFLKKMFEDMLRVREFDQRAIALQRQGRIGTYAPTSGQEAIQIGTAMATQDQDWLVPSFREQGVLFTRGVSPAKVLLFFMGTEEANRIPRKYRTLPFSVPCASQLLQAVGIAMAIKIKKEPSVVLTYFGDGATSEGDFHEGLNFAGVYQVPVVFICQNNQWAISTRRKAQTHSETIAQKAFGYGIDGLQVDGNDILAVFQATLDAVEQARRTGRPTLLECVTYRMGVHTTADDPTRYREDSEVQEWLAKDPIDRFEKYLLGKGVLQKEERKTMAERIKQELIGIIEEAEEICSHLHADEMLNYIYAELPTSIQSQKEELKKYLANKDGDHDVSKE